MVEYECFRLGGGILSAQIDGLSFSLFSMLLDPNTITGVRMRVHKRLLCVDPKGPEGTAVAGRPGGVSIEAHISHIGSIDARASAIALGGMVGDSAVIRLTEEIDNLATILNASVGRNGFQDFGFRVEIFDLAPDVVSRPSLEGSDGPNDPELVSSLPSHFFITGSEKVAGLDDTNQLGS